MSDDQATAMLSRLADCCQPWLIGVRHHSAALARVLPQLLDDYQPACILLEMPPDFVDWLAHLAKADLQSPVALAACDEARLVSFYPLADFSPELVAIRWAFANGVPIVPCDLDLASLGAIEDFPHESPQKTDQILPRLIRDFDVPDSAELWEKMVETPAVDSTPEAIRRAALLFGWMVRSSGNDSASDAYREAAMRAAIADAPAKSVAIVGSFHASALLPEPALWTAPEPSLASLRTSAAKQPKPITSMVPYSFPQLDQRSGYPAGILDPAWQQARLSAGSVTAANEILAEFAVALCRQLRQNGHVAGTPDAMEIVRVAEDLGRLRGHGAGRRELLEGVETTLVQGDLLGRGRAIAAAAQVVFAGDRRGSLPADVPRSGLAVQVESTLKRLRAPGPDSGGDEPREMRLDPLRSRLDRSRAVVFRRLNLIGVAYASRVDTEGVGNRENLTELWRVAWTQATAATLEAAGTHGVTLEQACQAAIRRLNRADSIDPQHNSPQHNSPQHNSPQHNSPQQNGGDETLHPATTLVRLTAAAECGLGGTVRELAGGLSGGFMEQASAATLVDTAALIQRIRAGHIAGLPRPADNAESIDVTAFIVATDELTSRPLVEAAIRQTAGLIGSNEPGDVVTIVDLSAMVREQATDATSEISLSGLRPSLISRLRRMRRDGSPRMQGAAWGALAMLSEVDELELGTHFIGWYDSATTADGRKQFRTRLEGILVPLLPLLSGDPAWIEGLQQPLADSTDDEFLSRLPALRGGFSAISPADRVSLLRDRIAILEPGGPTTSGRSANDDPAAVAISLAADRAGRAAIAELMPEYAIRDSPWMDVDAKLLPVGEPPGEIGLTDRWRLVLGVKGCGAQRARHAASTLDQLYGASARAGRGQREDLSINDRGGTEAPSPAPRDWVADVEGLFGKDVYQEVVGEAAAGGRLSLIEFLSPDKVNPSVDLLQQILSLRGALPERELELLRKLARRITDGLAERLANRLRPALTGLSTARPTRRKSPRLDCARTLAANLATAYRRDGRVKLAPRRMIFRAPAKRQMDWHVIFVVDVSGSMEASVIYSALVAAIFSSLPAIDVRFFAFSTEIIDLSDSVDDPLSLLMEVQVGGGTYIGLGMRAAREAVKNPSRTLVVLVSDFEEGVSVPELLAEVRMLADSGVQQIGLAALDDDAKPRFHAGNAAAVAGAGMPVAAVSPERLAQWVGDQIRGKA
jgi:hypothetical protein